jgi:hypothetical protein
MQRSAARNEAGGQHWWGALAMRSEQGFELGSNARALQARAASASSPAAACAPHPYLLAASRPETLVKELWHAHAQLRATAASSWS